MKVTHGEITSIIAIPRCDIPALTNAVNCFLDPEKERATKVQPRLIAIAQRSISFITFGVPFLFWDPSSAVAEYCPFVKP